MALVPDADIFSRRESQVRSYCRSFPAVFVRASGHSLWDDRGRKYVDLLCGAGSLNYGHNPPSIVRAVTGYLADGGPVQSLDLHTAAKAEFLRRFGTEILTPRGLGDFVLQFPGPAGTLAVEAALKLARKITGRQEIVAFRGGFHGASLGSLAATSSPLLRGAAGVHLTGATIHSVDMTDEGSLAGLASAVDRGWPPAAILLETVQGEGGLGVASAAWLAGIRRLADEIGALLIVDDIQAGCGRTGTFFSFDRVPDFQPDLVCLSKSLSGMGLPLAALLIRRDRDVWAPGEHNGTFRGHNLAFVGATAALDYWLDPSFVSHIEQLSGAIRADLSALAARLPAGLATPAGRGTMSGLRFTDPDLAEQISQNLFRAGIVAETCGNGRVLKLFPPLTMTVADWLGVSDRIAAVVVATVGARAGIAA